MSLPKYLAGDPANLRTYRTWIGIHNRCCNPKEQNYRYYGGRGITVCDRWRHFLLFLADMGPRPEGMTIERIENDGPYSPDNCRWATWSEQANNTRNTHHVEHAGERLSISQWARRLGIDRASVRNRLAKYPVEIALSPALPCRVTNTWRTAKSSTGYKGVYRRINRYEARIKRNGKAVYLGLFPTPEAAALAYNAAATEAYGPLARLNVIPAVARLAGRKAR